jgi:hypothetical protein
VRGHWTFRAGGGKSRGWGVCVHGLDWLKTHALVSWGKGDLGCFRAIGASLIRPLELWPAACAVGWDRDCSVHQFSLSSVQRATSRTRSLGSIPRRIATIISHLNDVSWLQILYPCSGLFLSVFVFHRSPACDAGNVCRRITSLLHLFSGAINLSLLPPPLISLFTLTIRVAAFAKFYFFHRLHEICLLASFLSASLPSRKDHSVPTLTLRHAIASRSPDTWRMRTPQQPR